LSSASSAEIALGGCTAAKQSFVARVAKLELRDQLNIACVAILELGDQVNKKRPALRR
jgi:hypothetical protein